jgi:hypothetical protein
MMNRRLVLAITGFDSLTLRMMNRRFYGYKAFMLAAMVLAITGTALQLILAVLHLENLLDLAAWAMICGIFWPHAGAQWEKRTHKWEELYQEQKASAHKWEELYWEAKAEHRKTAGRQWPPVN